MSVKIKNIDGIFFILNETDSNYSGVYLDNSQFVFKNNIIILSPKSNEIENAYAIYASIRKERTVDNGMTMNRNRHYSLFNSLEQQKKFPLINIVPLAIEALNNYFKDSKNALDFNLCESQIKELIEATDLDLSDYSITSNSSIENILEDSGALEKLKQSINKMSPESLEVEKFLLRNEDFKKICIKAVHKEAMMQKSKEIDNIENEIQDLDRNKEELNNNIKELTEKISELQEQKKFIEGLISEIDDLTKKRNFLKETLNCEKEQFFRSIICDGLTSRVNRSVDPLSTVHEFPLSLDLEPLENENEFIESLKKNIARCLDSESSLGMLSKFIYSALKLKMSIIIANDPFDIISNCISALLDGRLCSCIDASNIDAFEAITQIQKSRCQILRIDGCIDDLNFKKYFSIDKQSDKHLIFSCNDRVVLNAAPPELWYYAILVDLEDMKIRTDKITKYSSFKIEPDLEIDGTDWAHGEKLMDEKIITPMQNSILARLYNLSKQDNNVFLKLQCKQMAMSNQKTTEYHRVCDNEQ